MRAVHIQKYGRLPILANCPIPPRIKGQFLIKMKYAPINPSDLFFYLGLYGIKKEGTPIMGFEGSGVVEDCDQSDLKGKSVSVFANLSNGTYAEYMVSNPNEVMVWPKDASISQQEMSMCFVNPFSVLGMVDLIEQEQAQTVVLSAATSNTSQMLMRCLKKHQKDIKVFGMSRSAKYDQELKSEGFDQVYRMDQAHVLKAQLKNHKKAMFMDCVGGSYAGQVFNALPPKSIMVNYGRLSKENLGSIDLGQLYYRDKRIRGFWLNNYLNEITWEKARSIKREIIDNSELFRQKIRRVFPMEQFQKATRESTKDQSQGKILLDLSK